MKIQNHKRRLIMLGVFSAFSLQYPVLAFFNQTSLEFPYLMLYLLCIWLLIIIGINFIFWSRKQEQKKKDD